MQYLPRRAGCCCQSGASPNSFLELSGGAGIGSGAHVAALPEMLSPSTAAERMKRVCFTSSGVQPPHTAAVNG